jgi:NAD+ diphosphatase
MIQDIFPHKLHNEFRINVESKENDIVFAFENAKLWMKPAEPDGIAESGKENVGKEDRCRDDIAQECVSQKELCAADKRFFQVRDLTIPQGEQAALTYLFSIDEQAFFLWTSPEFDMQVQNVTAAGESGTSGGANVTRAQLVDIRELREQNQISPKMAFAVYTAKHLADWYRDNRFCGRCGGRMEHSKTERAMKCKCCGYTSYPRIMPAVIVGVTNGEELLITKYRTGFRHNALIAGFTEIGETLEETVQREVMEEAGIRVKNIRYYKSQPWGIANDILVGFYCDVDGDTTIRMDEQELGYAEWTKREDIVLQPNNYSLTNEMMSRFKNNEKSEEHS